MGPGQGESTLLNIPFIGFFKRLLENVQKQRRYITVTGLYLIERVFNLTVSFIVFAVFARSYGPVLVGVYSYAQTVMQFAVPFLAAGSEAVVIRELVRGVHPHGEVIGSAFVVLSAVGLGATLAPLAFIFLTNGFQNPLWSVSLLLGLGFIPNGFLVAEQALKADVKPVPIIAARIISSTMSSGARLFLILRGYPIEAVAAVVAAEAFILSGLMMYAYHRTGYLVRTWRTNFKYASFLLRQAAPAMIAWLVITLFYRANNVLLVFLSTMDAVGQYSVAFQVAQIVLVLPSVLFSAIYPRLVHLHATDSDRYESIINLCYLGFSCLGYAIIIFNFFVGHILFQFLFGTRYALASEIMVVLSVANLFNFLASVRGVVISISNAMHYHMLNALVGLAILLPSSVFLIERYGAMGAAWSITVACFVSGILTSFMIPGTRGTGIAQIKALFLLPLFRGSLPF
jgi:O-antigen/teichoic acid export membrane protein